MASHIFSTDVHAYLSGHITFKEPENSFIIFYHEENDGEWRGAFMHPCAEGGGCLCQVMQHEVALGVGSGAFTSPGSYFRDSSKCLLGLNVACDRSRNLSITIVSLDM